jgi:autotransporter-associated beta strand protein
LTLRGENTEDNEITGGIQDGNGANGGITRLVKTDTGKWVLSGAKTYTGTTTIQTGRLDVAGSLTSAITVEDGAVLGGEGSTSSNVVFGTGSGAGRISIDNDSTAFGTTAYLDTSLGVEVVLEELPSGKIKVIEYGTWSGNIADFSMDSASDTSRTELFTSEGNAIWLDVGSADRTWDGDANPNPTYWDIDTTTNWLEGDNLYIDGDTVTFGDAGAGAVDVREAVTPNKVTFSNTAGNDYVIENNSITAVSGIVVNAEGDVTIASTIGGTSGLSKGGSSSGTLTLTMANTYTGDTLLEGGETVVSNSAAFGTGTVTIDDQSSGTDPTITLANGVNVTNALAITDLGWWRHIRTESGGGNYATWSGDITSSESNYEMFKLGANGSDQTLELSGDLTAPGIQIFQNGGGTVYLSGSNTISGLIHVRNWGASLRVGDNNALGGATVLMDEKVSVQLDDGITTPDDTPLTVGTVGALERVLELFDGGAAESATFGGSITISNNNAGKFDVTAASGDTLTLAGAISGPGTCGIDKIGDGDVILSGSNTYSAAMVDVQAGTLWVDGDSSLCSQGVEVSSGAWLGGSGSWGGTVTNQNGGGVAWSLDASTASGDLDLDIGGNLALEGNNGVKLVFNRSGSTVDWTDAFWQADHAWLIVDVAGTTSGYGNLTLSVENWTDSASQSFDTVHPSARFFLRQDGDDIYLDYRAKSGSMFTVF